MRPFVLTLVLSVLAPMAAHAQEVQADPPASFQSGFGELHNRLGDQMGVPLSAEFPSPDNGDTLQLTTTGLSYWSTTHWPTWTNGWLHAALAPSGRLVQWEGADVDPPPISAPVADSATPVVRGWPLGGAIGQRIYCVEAIESHHGAAMYNRTPVWDGEHAQGWLGFLPSTARTWGAAIGNRASEWLAAARMIASGAGSQFWGIAAGRC
jgi:hypothetical protein